MGIIFDFVTAQQEKEGQKTAQELSTVCVAFFVEISVRAITE